MRIIDLHTHLAAPERVVHDALSRTVQTTYRAVRGRLPAAARAAIEIGGHALAPVERRLRDGAIALADRALALSRNRAMYLGRLGERLAERSGDLIRTSLQRATPRNLLDDMDDAGIAAAVVLALPPHVSTEEVLALCARAPDRLIPFCCPVPGTDDVGDRIAAWKAAGCRGIKMHPTLHGRPPADPFYHQVCEAADWLELPIVAHTGEVDAGESARHAALSRAEAYEPLLKAFPRVRFVLAHMNLFRPQDAIDVAVRNDNVDLDTSWQPAGVLRRARRRVGDQRLVFGSDWPILGSHLATALDTVAAGLDRKPEALERVFQRNAEELLKR